MVTPPISGQPLDQKTVLSHLVDVQLRKVKHAVFVHGRDCEELSADTSCLPTEAVCQFTNCLLVFLRNIYDSDCLQTP